MKIILFFIILTPLMAGCHIKQKPLDECIKQGGTRVILSTGSGFAVGGVSLGVTSNIVDCKKPSAKKYKEQ
ncbi:MAG: hypothetical protein ACR2NY_06730 [Alphaproteobacteria bacterium]